MRSIRRIIILAVIIFSLGTADGNTIAADSAAIDTFRKVNFFIDFSDYTEALAQLRR